MSRLSDSAILDMLMKSGDDIDLILESLANERRLLLLTSVLERSRTFRELQEARVGRNTYCDLGFLIMTASQRQEPFHMHANEELFKVRVVQLILRKEVEEALEALSQHHRVSVPRLKVGMPKRIGGKAGCYVSATKTIHVASMEKLYNPFVILHEFYHHLRTHAGKHKGTEKHADKFAQEYIRTYQGVHGYRFRFSYKD